jgi:phage terminase large subunit-like protein
VFSALPKVADSRLVVLTSAGDPAHWSHRILTEAISLGSWRVNQVNGPTPWISKEDLEEQRGLLPEWEYQRLHLNQWVEADDRLTTVDDVEAAVVLDGPQPAQKGRRYVIGLDLGLVRDSTVASVCHLETVDESTCVVLDRQETWTGSRSNPVRIEDVEGWLVRAVRSYNRATLVADPWQTQHLIQRLKRQRVRVVEYTFTTPSVGRLALTLHQLLKDRQLRLYPDEELVDELANVRLVETSPGNYKLDHDADKHDDKAISLALAAHHLIATSSKPKVDSNRLAAAMAQMSAELSKPSGGLVGY